MSERIECRNFQRKLDEGSEGSLSEEQRQLLRAHAEQCRDCGMLLRLRDHLAALSDGDLERLVPDELVDGMYGRVIDAVEERAAHRFRLSNLWRPRAILVPALSTAVVLLLVGTGWMFGQLRSVQLKEQELSLRVERQERQLLQVEQFTSLSVPSLDPKPRRLRDWRRSLAGHHDLSVTELQHLLERAPATSPVLDAGEAEFLLARIEGWLEPSRKRVLSGVRIEDGIAAAELLQILHDLDLDLEMEIPTARVLSLTRRFPSTSPSTTEREL